MKTHIVCSRQSYREYENTYFVSDKVIENMKTHIVCFRQSYRECENTYFMFQTKL